MRRLGIAVMLLTVLAAVPIADRHRAEARAGGRYAVLVGVDRHRNGSPRTNVGAVGDVKDVRIALERAGWPSGNIVELTDAHATGAKIREAMRWLAARSSNGSSSVFHYSGHVKQMDGDRDRDGEARDEFLWPWDSDFVSDRELGESMRAVRGWLWVNISGCEAAGLDDGINSPSRIFTGSSTEFEKSYEYPQWKNSVWTGLMVDQGMNQGKADGNGDGVVTLGEAFSWAAPQATAITRNQRNGPQHPYANGGDGAWTLRGEEPPPPPPESQPEPSPQPDPTPDPPDDGGDGGGNHRYICLGICIGY